MEIDSNEEKLMAGGTPIYTILENAVLFLCRESYPSTASLEIDAIICISSGNDKQDHVVKIHRTVYQTKQSKSEETVKLLKSLLSNYTEQRQGDCIYDNQDCLLAQNEKMQPIGCSSDKQAGVSEFNDTDCGKSVIDLEKSPNEPCQNSNSGMSSVSAMDVEMSKTDLSAPSVLRRTIDCGPMRNDIDKENSKDGCFNGVIQNISLEYLPTNCVKSTDKNLHEKDNAQNGKCIDQSSSNHAFLSNISDGVSTPGSPSAENHINAKQLDVQVTSEKINNGNQDICLRSSTYQAFDIGKIKTEHQEESLSNSCSLGEQHLFHHNKKLICSWAKNISCYPAENEKMKDLKTKKLNLSPDMPEIKKEVIDVDDENYSELWPNDDTRDLQPYNQTKQSAELQQKYASGSLIAKSRNFRTKRNNIYKCFIKDSSPVHAVDVSFSPMGESFRENNWEFSHTRNNKSSLNRISNKHFHIDHGFSISDDIAVDEYVHRNSMNGQSYHPANDAATVHGIQNFNAYTKTKTGPQSRYRKASVLNQDMHNVGNQVIDDNEQLFEGLNQEATGIQFNRFKSTTPQKSVVDADSYVPFTTGQKVKKFFCKYCGAGFTMNCTKIRHEKTTCSGAAYKCDVCDAKFSRTDSKARHMWTSHGIRSTARHPFSYECV